MDQILGRLSKLKVFISWKLKLSCNKADQKAMFQWFFQKSVKSFFFLLKKSLKIASPLQLSKKQCIKKIQKTNKIVELLQLTISMLLG